MASLTHMIISIMLQNVRMSIGGMMASNLIGAKFGRWAERVGGVALVGLGCSILVSPSTGG